MTVLRKVSVWWTNSVSSVYLEKQWAKTSIYSPKTPCLSAPILRGGHLVDQMLLSPVQWIFDSVFSYIILNILAHDTQSARNMVWIDKKWNTLLLLLFMDRMVKCVMYVTNIAQHSWNRNAMWRIIRIIPANMIPVLQNKSVRIFLHA